MMYPLRLFLLMVVVFIPAQTFAQSKNCVPANVVDEQTWSNIELEWTGQTVKNKNVTFISINGSRNLTARLDGESTSVAIGSVPERVPLTLFVDTFIKSPSQNTTTIGFALMDVKYTKKTLNTEVKNNIETVIENISTRLAKKSISLTVDQRKELEKLGVVRLDLTSVIHSSPSIIATQTPIMVDVLDRPDKSPGDLFTHGQRLFYVQKQYRSHVSAVRTAKSQYQNKAKIVEELMKPTSDILFAAEIVRLEMQTVKQALEGMPDHTSKKAKIAKELENLHNQLESALKPVDQPEVFVYVAQRKTSPVARAGYTQATTAVADAEEQYDNLMSKLRDDYRRNETNFKSVGDIKNAPELRNMQKQINWIKSVLPKVQPADDTENARVLQIRTQINTLKKEAADLKKSEKTARMSLDEFLRRAQTELKAMAKLTKKPVPDLLEKGSLRNTSVLVDYAIEYTDLHGGIARKSITDAQKELDLSYTNWLDKDKSLGIHTGYLLETRAASASAICTAYKNMSDNEPYKDLMDKTNKYITAMSFAPTAIMLPTPRNIELATSGELVDGYKRSIANIGRKAAIDALTYRTRMADDLRLIGAKVRSHELSLLRNRKFPKEFFKAQPTIPGRSKIDIFKDNVKLYDKTVTTISTAKTIYETAELYEKNDPTAAFKGMKAIMGSVYTADWALARYGFALPMHATLLSFHLAILADAAIASIEAGNRIADGKIDQALEASFVKSARQKLYSLDALILEQPYKTYVPQDEIMQRIATRYQSTYILHELAKNPSPVE